MNAPKPATLEVVQKVSRVALSLVDSREFSFTGFDGLDEGEQFLFWELIERNSLRVNAYHAFSGASREDEVPAPTVSAAKREIDREMNRESRAAALVRALTQSGIDCIVLKGSAIGHGLIGFPNYKRMNDFDFLVKKSDAQKTVQIIESLGYFSSRAIFGKSTDVDLKKHHSPPFYLPDGSCVLGLHWDLLSPHRSERAPLDELWSAKKPLSYGGVETFRLEWSDFLIHLATHLADAKIGVRELGDCALVLRKAIPTIDTGEMIERIKKWNALAKFRRSLHFVLAAFPDLGARADIARLLQQLDTEIGQALPLETTNRAAYGEAIIWLRTLILSRIEKFFALSKLCPDPSDRYHYWKSIYLAAWSASDEDLGAVQSRIYLQGEAPSSVSRWIFPWKCIRALAKDHGPLLIVIVTAIHAVQALWTGFRLKLGILKPTGERLAVQSALMELE